MFIFGTRHKKMSDRFLYLVASFFSCVRHFELLCGKPLYTRSQTPVPRSPFPVPAFSNIRSAGKKKKNTNSIVFSQGAGIGIYCFGLNSKIWKLVNTRGVVKQSRRDGSVLNRSPQWSFHANPHPIRRVTLKTRMFCRS